MTKASLPTNIPVEPGKLWWNWFGELYFTPTLTARPKSIEDVRACVMHARREGLPVRVSGKGHSNPAMVPTAGMHIDFSDFAGVEAVDAQTGRVTIQPGIAVGDLSRHLRHHGLSLNNQGDIDTQTVVGAMATGTHGAGVTLPCFSAQMVAATIVTADGDILELSQEKDGDLFRALRCSLGLLGVVVSATLQAVPSYNILKRSWYADREDCIGNLHELLNAHRTFWFFWLPDLASAQLYGLPADIPDRTSRRRDVCHMRSYDALPVQDPMPELGEGEVCDHSSVIFPNAYEPNFREIEYAVPFGRFEEAFAEIQHMFATRYPEAFYPVECRPVKEDTSMLSAYAGRDGYAMSISGPLEVSTWPILSEADAILDRYDARPHWGKHHFMTPERLQRIYPEYDAFRKLRREMDPRGVFLNDHLAQLFV